tara:strand:- start:1454 stop:1732 length:279 start_codon:yes stop_codon:yes gene_type:complete
MSSKSPLKRTDTKSIPIVKSYIKDSKYDKPQKNARKIDWDEDDKKKMDYKMMPPPPIPKSPSPPIVNPNKGSPHPKKFKKNHNSKLVLLIME